jgi:hypothetical protein
LGVDAASSIWLADGTGEIEIAVRARLRGTIPNGLREGQRLEVRGPFEAPSSAERRKAVGIAFPKGGSPRRPVMTEEIRAGLLAHSPNVQFSVALLLGRHTVSRNSSVRQLRWENVDLAQGTVLWRGRLGSSPPHGPEAANAAEHLPDLVAAGQATVPRQHRGPL